MSRISRLAFRCALIAALLMFALQQSSANEIDSMQQRPFVQGAPRTERRWMGSFAFAGIPQLKHRARHRGIYGTQFSTKP